MCKQGMKDDSARTTNIAENFILVTLRQVQEIFCEIYIQRSTKNLHVADYQGKCTDAVF
jgi:hypothetical protein